MKDLMSKSIHRAIATKVNELITSSMCPTYCKYVLVINNIPIVSRSDKNRRF